jgi:hypothetical protein
LKWIGKRWLAIRQERGFDALEGWALKEISDRKFFPPKKKSSSQLFSKDIEVPIEDLLNPLAQAKNSPKRTKTTNSSRGWARMTLNI